MSEMQSPEYTTAQREADQAILAEFKRQFATPNLHGTTRLFDLPRAVAEIEEGNRLIRAHREREREAERVRKRKNVRQPRNAKRKRGNECPLLICMVLIVQTCTRVLHIFHCLVSDGSVLRKSSTGL